MTASVDKLYFKITEATGVLFDAYRELLSRKQRLYFERYWADDWSLAEISAEYAISRSAVYDTIKRTVQKLHLWEAKLHLVAQQTARFQVYEAFPDCEAVHQLVKLENE